MLAFCVTELITTIICFMIQAPGEDLCCGIRLEWTGLTVTNTSAYYSASSITAVKGFIGQVPGFATFTFSVVFLSRSFIMLVPC
jgi:hypothetical protein